MKVRKDVRTIERTLLSIVKEHSDTLDTSNPRDVLDELLIASQEYNFDTNIIVHTVCDLLLGGTDTTSISLYWFIAFMINYPDIAARLRAELDEKIGKNSEITIEKCKTCAYLNACIQETLRLNTPGPVSVPHCPPQPVTLGHYLIPANVMIIPLIHSVNRDPQIWGPDAEEFRPERFLEGASASVHFGLGLRRCVGEELAKIELMVHAANLMLNFLWKSPQGEGKMKMDACLGLTLAPVYTDVIVSAR